MAYDRQPVYHDPPSNQWFGFQAWSMSGSPSTTTSPATRKAKAILDKWVAWAIANTTIRRRATCQIPSTLTWTGEPDTWNTASPGANTGLHVTVTELRPGRRRRRRARP